jgi:hypothetical protein
MCSDVHVHVHVHVYTHAAQSRQSTYSASALAHLAHPDITVDSVALVQHLDLTLDQEEHLAALVALAHHGLTRRTEERPHCTHDNVYEARVGADLGI